MEDGRHGSVSQAPFELFGRPYDLERSIRLFLQAIQVSYQPVGEALRVLRVERRSPRNLVAVVCNGQRRLLGPAVVLGVRRVAREKATAEASLAGPRQVDVAKVAALEKGTFLTAVGKMEVE